LTWSDYIKTYAASFWKGEQQMKNMSGCEMISTEKRRLGPYPMDKLHRVEQPTTKITDPVQKVSERDSGFLRAARGEFGPLVAKEIRRFTKKEPINAAYSDMVSYLRAMGENEVAHQKAPVPDDPAVMGYHIKRLGYFLRADIVGICRLPQYAVYSHDARGNPIELDHKYAVLIVTDQDYTTMNGSTGRDWISGAQSYRGYSNNGFITSLMANYIRRLGYPAEAHFHFHYKVLIPPLLVLSGIGEMSRAGDAVLNPFLGTRFKAGAVTTDLPLLPDRPVDFGLQEFCRTCMKCAVECPAGAISMGEKVMHNGYEVWKLDVERCTTFRIYNQNGGACGRCIKVCPWNKPQGLTHDTVRWLVKHTPFMDGLIAKMDDIWGYGRQDRKDKWWFDLEEVDGMLQLPRTNRKR
jgi:reductive dehalogenase